MPDTDYRRPGWFTLHVFNPTVARLSRWGLSVAGSQVLRVRGRRSGQWRETPVNVLVQTDGEFLVAARGVTNWVANVRVDPAAELVRGRSVRAVRLVEVPAERAAPVLRAYLKRWKWEVGAFFDGVGPDATEAELLAAVPRHPVFRIEA